MRREDTDVLVLISNDDGIDSTGLHALVAAIAQVAEVVVLAPNRNWSAGSHQRTFDRPLRISDVHLPDGTPAHACDGTPADCVAVGLLGFLPRRPDLVVSGINKGANMGDDIIMSGTVAAAMAGVIGGVPGVAISQAGRWDAPEWNFEVAARFAAALVADLGRTGVERDLLLNVNIPDVPRGAIAGVEVTRAGRRIYADELIERVDPAGRRYYWVGGEMPGAHTESGTDVTAVADGKISVTPIHLDMTNHRLLDEIARRDWRAITEGLRTER
jgi:5'-nucleotidase